MSYNASMAKPKSSNRSIRLPDDDWAWAAAEAERRQTSVNGVIAALVALARQPTYAERAMARVEAGGFTPQATPFMEAAARGELKPQPKAKQKPKAEPAPSAKVSVSLPLAGTFKRPPMQKGGKK